MMGRWGSCSVLMVLAAACATLWAADPIVEQAQAKRIEVVARAAPSVVAIFGKGGNGGGSGVVISPDGYVLTNFHVTSGAGDFMKCGLNDGRLYDGVIVGIDPTGDVALVKLLGRSDFPFAPLGDSDKLQVGDWVYAMGNPFLLATDFHPTVTYGIVSGVHRYQYPAGTILEYTDCIQIDTSINPGNSGGPLFNEEGELVGINGRGSFEKRGRVNSGAGYAISINQIKNFMDHLRSGRIVDHATLGATVTTNEAGEVVFANLLEQSEAYRRGIREGDELVSFAGRPIGSVNQFKNILGIYPRGWKLPIVYRRGNTKFEAAVRLRGLHTMSELTKLVEPRRPPGGPERPRRPGGPGQPEPMPMPRPMPLPMPGADAEVPEEYRAMLEKKEGFANFYFNRIEQQRVLGKLASLGDYASRSGRWKFSGEMAGSGAYEVVLTDDVAGLNGKDVALQKLGPDDDLLDEPKGTGGLLTALHHWRILLGKGTKSFTNFYYLGSEPLDGVGETVDVLVGELTGARSYWYVSQESGALIGGRFELTDDAEPCELRFSDWTEQGGVRFPGTIVARHAEKDVVRLSVSKVDLAK